MPAAPRLFPKDIQLIGSEVAILWQDGTETYYPMEALRAASPSAETTGERDLLGHTHGGDSRTEYPGVTVTGFQLIGGYAIQFQFSDGHDTGLYAFPYLLEIHRHLTS